MSTPPVTRVVLYKHGVGHFEREGTVAGFAVLNLTFKQAEVSDVLKSLTVLDLDGGRVAAVSYDSTKPLEQLLADVALSIPDKDSLVALLPQLKGARVLRVRRAAEEPLEGVILGVDATDRRVENGVLKGEKVVSLLTDGGEVRTFDLFGASAVELLDEKLRADLNFYLRTQLSLKKKDARTFTFFAQGDGERRIRLSYVLAAPVWKATYRLLLGEEGRPPTVQGWAVVDNMQDEDWDNVQLALVAGLPVSFVHDLYTPRYLRRPEVRVQETSGVLPPMVEEGVEMAMYGEALAAPAAAPKRAFARVMGEAGGRGGYGGGSEGGALYSRSAVSTTPAQVRERQVGDHFEYAIDHPVTIRRNQSALVPILLKPFDGRSVLLYQEAARSANPMRCVEFTNTTGLTLEGGPVTVLEAGSYVGEAMLDTLKPSDQRLIAYAVELAVRVHQHLDTFADRVTRVAIRDGIVHTYSAQVNQTTYTFVSKSDRGETVYLDHPRGGDEWKLHDTPAPHETTENHWRFRFELPARQTVRFPVKARLTTVHAIALQRASERDLALWLEQRYFDAATAEVVRRIADLAGQLSGLEYQVQQLGQEREGIHAEQKRIRENLQSLGDRSEERTLRERFVRTLNAQEDRLEQIERERKERTAERDRLQGETTAAIAKLQYEGDLR